MKIGKVSRQISFICSKGIVKRLFLGINVRNLAEKLLVPEGKNPKLRFEDPFSALVLASCRL
jgi:hypothetical protein